MIGRAAYNDPWGCLADADRSVFGAEANPASSRRQVLRDYAAYGDAMVGRFQVGARCWGQGGGAGGAGGAEERREGREGRRGCAPGWLPALRL
jgi:hypothetical protein